MQHSLFFVLQLSLPFFVFLFIKLQILQTFFTVSADGVYSRLHFVLSKGVSRKRFFHGDGEFVFLEFVHFRAACFNFSVTCVE